MDYLNVIEIAWNMDDTPEKEKLLEQAITIADKYNDLKTSVEAREMLITSYMTTGFPKKQLQALVG